MLVQAKDKKLAQAEKAEVPAPPHLLTYEQSPQKQMHKVRSSSEKEPNPSTEVEYIDLLIESEKVEKKPGYLDRIKYYEQVRQSAQIQTGVLSMDTTTAGKGQGKSASRWDSIRGWW